MFLRRSPMMPCRPRKRKLHKRRLHLVCEGGGDARVLRSEVGEVVGSPLGDEASEERPDGENHGEPLQHGHNRDLRVIDGRRRETVHVVHQRGHDAGCTRHGAPELTPVGGAEVEWLLCGVEQNGDEDKGENEYHLKSLFVREECDKRDDDQLSAHNKRIPIVALGPEHSVQCRKTSPHLERGELVSPRVEEEEAHGGDPKAVEGTEQHP
mmetsp:Transcript_51368/g.111671  ORF Transcript_51368/g.111671 Transcript_51368/m.111671 type:complete len:210 (-) Transcript_51368:1061-1690(-)